MLVQLDDATDCAVRLACAEAAAVATWSRIKSVLLALTPPDEHAAVTFPIRIDPPELAEGFARDLARLARADAGTWSSAWAQLAFEIGGSRVVVYGAPLLAS